MTYTPRQLDLLKGTLNFYGERTPLGWDFIRAYNPTAAEMAWLYRELAEMVRRALERKGDGSQRLRYSPQRKDL